MSQYLMSRVLAAPNIEVRFFTEVVGARGDGHLEAVTLADRGAGNEEEVKTNGLFVFIGAAPRTDWLGETVVRDGRGFVLAGPDLPPGPTLGWSLERSPYASRRACRVSSPPGMSASTA
jgi:thioredoxin reductase (NADPH)